MMTSSKQIYMPKDFVRCVPSFITIEYPNESYGGLGSESTQSTRFLKTMSKAKHGYNKLFYYVVFRIIQYSISIDSRTRK